MDVMRERQGEAREADPKPPEVAPVAEATQPENLDQPIIVRKRDSLLYKDNTISKY